MNICYLLESSGLWGGVKNVFDQARGLQNRGHDVIIRARTGDHSWYPYPLSIEYVDVLSRPFMLPKSKPDVVVATFWTTVEHAIRMRFPKKFHLCQGYEGDFHEYAHLRGDIERAYRTPIPKIVNGPWLADVLESHFGAGAFEMYIASPIVDTDIFKPQHSLWKQFSKFMRKDKRLLVTGQFESAVKAIPDALQSVRILREKGVGVTLIRVSTEDTIGDEQTITRIDKFYECLTPIQMANLYRQSDLFLSSSLAQEGFGLPFAEALACGIPCVVTDIPSYRSLDPAHDYALFVPQKDPHAMAAAAFKVLKDRELQDKLTRKGPFLIQRDYNTNKIAERLEKIFLV